MVYLIFKFSFKILLNYMEQYFYPKKKLTNQIVATTPQSQLLSVFAAIHDNNYRNKRSVQYKAWRKQGIKSFKVNKKNRPLKLYNIVLKKLNSRQQTKDLIKKIKSKKLDTNKNLYFQAEEGPQWQGFLENVLESSSEALMFFCARLKFLNNIHKVVSSISFTRLEILRLHDCPITSFEMISFMNAPNLTSISIIGCRITNIKSLVKTNFSKYRYPLMIKIRKLYLVAQHTHGYTQDFSPLTRTLFDQDFDQNFQLTVTNNVYTLSAKDIFQLNNYQFLVKLQANQNKQNVRMRKAVNGFIEKFVKDQNCTITTIQLLNQYYGRHMRYGRIASPFKQNALALKTLKSLKQISQK